MFNCVKFTVERTDGSAGAMRRGCVARGTSVMVLLK